jgi:catechol 2,3-dioxygenase-like lactoylglutathione lyase family enzyme
MPATLRLELFTSSPPRALHLYADTLNFQILVRKNNDAYIFLRRDHIFLALMMGPDPLTFPDVPWGEAKAERALLLGGAAAASVAGEDENARKEVLRRTRFRRPPYGTEIVIEVDDLQAERDRVVKAGYELEADIEKQEWGLWDFRIIDADGYYLRFTTHSARRNGLGEGRQGEALAEG